MKHIKAYENFREIYKINPNKEVVILDEYLSKVANIGKSAFSDKDLPDKDQRIEEFRGRAGKMTYNYGDDFFARLDFGDEVFNNIPVYMLAHKDKYEVDKNIKKFNL
jgi:hypothetical protein